ncbi:protein TAB2 homolog, chloroplastic-like [Bidens hawaiensis]|uniref:protein TAB2 homolog, chloroplastic-like n=1 Tax=Bidens hawaiensis TaxID=980011 RepID=UPI00404B82F1
MSTDAANDPKSLINEFKHFRYILKTLASYPSPVPHKHDQSHLNLLLLTLLLFSFTSMTSLMATLSFNTTRINNINTHIHQIPSNSHHPSSPNHHTTTTLNPSHSESPVSLPVDDEQQEDEDEDDPTAELSYLDPETVTEWELDFCSRPILDIRGKKIWELVACDSSLSLQYTKYFPNNVINSVTLKDAIVSICDELDVPIPDKIRFFRSQMQTIITRACKELGIKPIPSKRCLSLLLWLEERYETVYKRHPGFQKGSKPLLALDNPFPMDLPDTLYGEKWAFVQLPFSDVKKELETLEKSFAFGATLDLDLLGIEIDDNTLIPGLAVASSRARPLAAWMNGLEVCSVEANLARANLVLSVGISTRYVYASYKKSPVTTSEAEAWEAAKKNSGGLHFLAIQDSLDSDDCVGFWLLLDLPPSPV